MRFLNSKEINYTLRRIILDGDFTETDTFSDILERAIDDTVEFPRYDYSSGGIEDFGWSYLKVYFVDRYGCGKKQYKEIKLNTVRLQKMFEKAKEAMLFDEEEK